MFCNTRLKTMTLFCTKKDRTRPALLNVCFEGDRAVATDGVILAVTTFPASEQPEEEYAPIHSGDEPFSVSAGAIEDVFAHLLKMKRWVGSFKGVFVAPGKVQDLMYPGAGNLSIEEKVEQNYPNYRQVFPVASPDDTVVSFGVEPLEKLVKAMRQQEYQAVTLRIPQQGAEGYVIGACSFVMGTDPSDQITGVVMPCRIREEERKNPEKVPITQDDVNIMLSLLSEIALENETVQYMRDKYAKLLKEEEEEEKR